MTTKETKQFEQFREEVLKYKSINNETLFILITRYTQPNMGRRFFNEKLKHKYYTFWIKRLVGCGILKETEFWGVWKVDGCEKRTDN